MDERSRADLHPADGRFWADLLRYEPTAADVESLIDGARRHPLGLEFLRKGQLGAVATIFGTHAFTVVAARDHLARTAR